MQSKRPSWTCCLDFETEKRYRKRDLASGQVLSHRTVNFMVVLTILSTIWSRLSDIKSRGIEICYQLRYMEPNNHAQGENWSERQIGVYHKFSSAPGAKGIVILLHAMLDSKAQKRIEDTFSAGQYHEKANSTPLRLHVLIFTTYMDSWRWYMNDLGEICLRLVRKLGILSLGWN